MKNKMYSQYGNGETAVAYVTGERGEIGMLLFPADGTDAGTIDSEVLSALSERQIEPLVQLHVRGDMLPSGYANGATMCGSGSTGAMHLSGQYERGGEIVTELSDGRGRFARHTLAFCGRAATVYTEFINGTDSELTLEMISSGSFGMLSPFDPGEQPRGLEIITAESAWSSEGRLKTETAESLNLEVSWLRSGVRVYRIGQTGSMPVRGHFPFMAVRDTKNGVAWAASLSAASSWQMEARRRDTGLSLTGGIADYDFGHWAKTLQPGESFRTPSMYIAAARGDIDDVCDALLDAYRIKHPNRMGELPVMFNEYCTTWGAPSHENIKDIVGALAGRGFEYLVIDAGWFRSPERGWWDTVGDWNVDEEHWFPNGLKSTADMIRDAGMIPGLWFEPETCASGSEIRSHTDMLLTRGGAVIDTGSRRFLDMRKAEVREYLRGRVIALLRDCGLGYVKIDYNDCIGIGCDGAESLGEGLRQNIEASLDFYRELRRECIDIVMEDCASGGHSLTPAFLELFDMASFSDAHECVYIPIIAANLHRLMLPGQSQIWAVLHGTDSLRRIHYSMVNTFLGVMCLSGDIYTLGEDAWRVVTDDIAFYKRVRHIIRDGHSRIYRGGVTENDDSYRDPRGWQAVVRKSGDEVLAVLHTFGGYHDGVISTPLEGYEIAEICALDEAGNGVVIGTENGCLTAVMPHDFDAAAVLLRRVK